MPLRRLSCCERSLYSREPRSAPSLSSLLAGNRCSCVLLRSGSAPAGAAAVCSRLLVLSVSGLDLDPQPREGGGRFRASRAASSASRSLSSLEHVESVLPAFILSPDFYETQPQKPHNKLKKAQMTLRENKLSFELKLGGESDNPTSKGTP